MTATCGSQHLATSGRFGGETRGRQGRQGRHGGWGPVPGGFLR